VDLGCGDGRLLKALIESKKISGMGIDFFGTEGCLSEGGRVIWVLPKFEGKILITKENYDYMLNNLENGLDAILLDYVQELSLKQQYLSRNDVIIDVAKKVFLPMYYDDFKVKYTGVYRQIKNRIKNKKDVASKFVFLHDIIKMLAENGE